MRPAEAIKAFFAKSFAFSGRAPSPEYWKRFGLSLLVTFVLQVCAFTLVRGIMGPSAVAPGPLTSANMPFGAIFLVSVALISFLMLSTTARRFQDHGWSGRWFLWMFYLLGPAAVLVLVTVVGILTDKNSLANFGFFSGFFSLFPIYASIVWTFWIGFVKSTPGPNRYGPNPLEVTP